jgi:CTP:molybdopterin cytidylyltransferase MocA
MSLRAVGLLLAAGHSRRFGTADKLAAPLDGRPLVTHSAAALAALPLAAHLVVLRDPGLAASCPGLTPVPLPPGAEAQSDSLCAGIAAAAALDPDLVLIALGDMPRVTTADLATVLDRARATGLRCAAAGPDGPLPPACFPAADLPALLALGGDRGAGALLRDLPAAQRVPLPPAHLVDVDTPEGLAALG